MNILKEVAKGESKTLEFKEILPSNSNIIKTIIAFSNTAGGKLIIGVDNYKNLIGIDDKNIFKIKDKIASIIYDSCYPNILPEIYTITVEDKLLLVVEVFRGNLIPYYIKKDGKNNGTVIRIGATNRKASFENIMELERQRNNISYDEEINYDVDFNSLDLSVIYKEFEKQNKQIDINKLKNLKLIKEEHSKLYATNALLIAIGYYEHSVVKCARFKGTTMEIFTDKKEYSSDIFSILSNSLSFIQNHINLKGEIKGLYRVDTYEIPTVALREALTNALVHRDYTNQGRDIKVGIYDDIVNIVSPGGLPNNITLEDIYNGRSETRNKILANLFKELELIEKWGTGINRIKKLCKDKGLKEPIFSEKNDFVDIEFSREKETTQETTQKTTQETTQEIKKLTTKQKIVQELKNNKYLTREELSKKIGVSSNAIKQHLSNLKKDGIIQRIGSTKSGYWKV
jgi:ATP-dependent DNA helicase RecG